MKGVVPRRNAIILYNTTYRFSSNMTIWQQTIQAEHHCYADKEEMRLSQSYDTTPMTLV